MRILGAFLILSVAVFGVAAPAQAEQQKTTLKVEGMTCPSCPYQVKKSLMGVEGVTAADVSLETKLATVTYDDEKANLAELTTATTNAGFPSQPVGQAGMVGQ